jgi:hypothetical protein
MHSFLAFPLPIDNPGGRHTVSDHDFMCPVARPGGHEGIAKQPQLLEILPSPRYLGQHGFGTGQPEYHLHGTV